MGKKWIDKKNSTTFHLVHRSQKDPLINDENASQMVLLPANPPNSGGKGIQISEFVEKFDTVEHPSDYGIFFKKHDNYDYLQHIKPIGEDPSGTFIPAKVKKEKKIQFELFGSSEEMSVGLANQQSHEEDVLRFDLPDDVREVFDALDDDAYVDDEAEDFFEALDNADLPDNFEDRFGNGLATIEEDEELEIEPWMKEFRTFKNHIHHNSDSDEEDIDVPKSNYSMSSSAMFRNKGLTLLDDQFEKILHDYEDHNLGQLDSEDESIKGEYDVLDPSIENQHLDAIFDEFLENAVLLGQSQRFVVRNESENIDSIRKELREDAKKLVDKYSKIEVGIKSTPLPLPEMKKKNEWDVESVLTTNSNIYNRPKLIKEISKGVQKIKLRRGMPVLEEPEAESEEESEPERETEPKETIVRKKNETAEEKRIRKQKVKQDKRARREQKKQHTIAFNDELLRQKKIEPNHKFQSKTIHL